MSSFGEQLKKLRLSKSYTQPQLVEELNSQGISISQSTISKIEHGERMPSVEIQNALADFFNVSIDYLHGKENTTVRLVDPLENTKMIETTQDETNLINQYRQLNNPGKELAQLQLKNLTEIPSYRKDNSILFKTDNLNSEDHSELAAAHDEPNDGTYTPEEIAEFDRIDLEETARIDKELHSEDN